MLLANALEYGWILRVKSKRLNKSTTFNYTDPDRPRYDPHVWNDAQTYRRHYIAIKDGNATSLASIYANNGFLRNAHVRPDVTPDQRGKTQSMVTVGVIAGLFLFMTFAVTLAVILVCRRRNSVFALPKNDETDDRDYEMDDIITDVDFSETEIDCDTDASWNSRASNQQPDSDHVQSPPPTSLVDSNEQLADSETDELSSSPVRTRCSCRHDEDSFCGHERLVPDCGTA